MFEIKLLSLFYSLYTHGSALSRFGDKASYSVESATKASSAYNFTYMAKCHKAMSSVYVEYNLVRTT